MKKQVIKRTGTPELFDANKLCQSIENAGASKTISNEVCTIVSDSIDSGVSTEDIFKLTHKYLVEFDAGLAALYALDRGLSALGPSGFIFEQYIGALFEELGYKVSTNSFMKGEVVEHEIDVLATKGNVVFVIEAKYKNDFHGKTPIDQVMYADAKIQDIRRRAQQEGDTRDYYQWVVTNTRFTNHSMNYVTKRDVQLMGWDYPRYINLKKIAYEKKLYPITVIPSITKSVLKQCAAEKRVLVKHLFPLTAEEIQQKFSVSVRVAKKLEQEVLELMY